MGATSTTHPSVDRPAAWARGGAWIRSRGALLTLAVVGLMALAAAPASAQTSLPTYVNTPNGSMHLEDRYLPGVVQSEIAWFAAPRGGYECLKAQSIAARTFTLRYLNNNGRTATIPALGPTFQAWSGSPSSAARSASQSVAGQVLTYQGYVIYANYASGAWPLDGNGFPFAPSSYGYSSSLTWGAIRTMFVQQQGSSAWRSQVTSRNSWAWTYVLNTDNEGRSGSAVQGTVHASAGVRNRGDLGQYRSYWLESQRGYRYDRIIRAFYGKDINIVGGSAAPTTSAPRTTAPTTTSPSYTTTTPSTSGAQAVRVSASALNVRGGPSIAYTVIGSLHQGDYVVVRARSGDWSKIDYASGVTAWCASAYLSPVSGVAAVQITTADLNVRTGPSTGYTRIGGAARGQLFVRLESQAGWSRIFWGGGTAWVSSTSSDLSVVIGL